MEHRWSQRVAVRAHVILARRGQLAVRGLLNDISLNGAFVATRVPYPRHCRIELVVPTPGDPASPQRLSAQVVRVTAQGVALAFFEFGSQPVRRLMSRLEPLRRGAHARRSDGAGIQADA